ncbi:membrane protein containing DUF540 [Candidatus Magnetomorum sp. HK-1]|nr:membrane protein containing DUF540 [Candidatus Magnetomorum sp. HK-1]
MAFLITQNYLKIPPGSPFSEFIAGFGYFRRGYLLVRKNPKLWWFALPSILCYLPVFFLFLSYFPTIILGIGRGLMQVLFPLWHGGFFGMLALFAIFVVGILTLFLVLIINVTLLFIATIVASIFNDILSEQTEIVYIGSKTTKHVPIKGIPRTYLFIIGVEFKKIGFFILVQSILFLFNILPVIGQIIYSVLGGIFTIYFIGFEYVDYRLSRRLMSFKQKWNLCLVYKWRVFGYGMAVSLLLLIPLLNVVVMSIAVVGATLISLDLYIDYNGNEITFV